MCLSVGPWDPFSVMLLLSLCFLQEGGSGPVWESRKESSQLSPDPEIILLELAESHMHLGNRELLTHPTPHAVSPQTHLIQPAYLTAKNGQNEDLQENKFSQ